MVYSHLCSSSLLRTEASQHNSVALLNTQQFYLA
jgi:hypothetical protein